MTSVSVVIPCFNQGRFLAAAIESVAAQTFAPIETVVVDDGSTDDTAAVAARYDVVCIRQENRGLGAARNAGLRQSTGEALVFLDADDLLAPDAIGAGVACLASRADLAFVYGSPRLLGAADPDDVPPPVEADFYRHLLARNFITMPGLVLHRRDVLEAVGGFDERLAAAEDYDVYLRITRRFPVAYCAGLRGSYRRHDANMSNDSLRMFRATSTVLRSQRRAALSSPTLYRSYRSGITMWRSFYGRWVVADAREQIASGRLGPARRSLTTLLRYHPTGFVSAVAGG
jgi:glycosyltransferase involved in cell wall biosynthesis